VSQTTDSTRTPAHRLCWSTVESVVARTGLQEALEVDLVSPMAPTPVGVLRTWTGGKGVAKAVYCGLSVDAIGLDSHMVFAFTDSGSLVPHFTLDSVFGQGSFAFHLDLIPRVELASNLPYVDHVYEPLTPVFEELSSREGLTPAAIGPRQRALMSPWMCVNRATEAAFAGMDGVVAAYLDHWAALVADGVPESLAAPVDLPDRDTRNRTALFSREVDPVWNTIERLIGEQSEQIRLQLVSNG
jgi:hypothetical protein